MTDIISIRHGSQVQKNNYIIIKNGVFMFTLHDSQRF